MTVWVVVLVLGAWSPLAAGDFDGSELLQCRSSDGVQLYRDGAPQPFQPESVGLPRIFIIDFKHKEIKPTNQSVVRRRSKIKRFERVESKVVLQGTEEGVEGVDDAVGWTMALAQDDGRFVITASGGDVGYIVFGSCRPAAP